MGAVEIGSREHSRTTKIITMINTNVGTLRLIVFGIRDGRFPAAEASCHSRKQNKAVLRQQERKGVCVDAGLNKRCSQITREQAHESTAAFAYIKIQMESPKGINNGIDRHSCR
jgi:hypothetical protein